MKSIWNYFNCNQMHKYFHSLIDLVLYSGFRSTSEDVVEVVVMPPAVHFLWPFGPFSRNRRKSPLNYRGHFGIIPLCKVLQNIPSVVVAVFIWEYSRVIRNITSILSYNLKATLLDCKQTEGNSVCRWTPTQCSRGHWFSVPYCNWNSFLIFGK